MTIMNTVFNTNYKWKILNNLQGISSFFEFPPKPIVPGESYIVEVIPNIGKSWVGNFHGLSFTGFFSGVFSSPDPWVIFIVSHGIGFFVNVKNLLNYRELEVIGITDVSGIKSLDYLLIVSYIEVIAYDREGVIWATNGLGDGEINLTKITEQEIIGNTWKPERGRNIAFSINPKNGDYKFLE